MKLPDCRMEPEPMDAVFSDRVFARDWKFPGIPAGRNTARGCEATEDDGDKFSGVVSASLEMLGEFETFGLMALASVGIAV
ncbi:MULTISPECIES: hypothetical protein [Burkholderia]|uniref:Uncharacterized protein n=1 Tax=Burkholderia semiarida TaxID=2843303 RepID=A0ABW7LCU9_9BURK|nr:MULTISPECIES: hypothetical protein [Burkholderia]MCA7972930.1 hypothetical protein [Burkholderia sp. AU39826]MCA8244757.1 hypothetical protein [Burkholderia sp. AU32262]MDN7702497.1 hypothetical protein [Burkholderia sp. AU44665]